MTPTRCSARPRAATDGTPADATTLAEVRTTIGADALDASGDGVDVALIDSGITPVGDLDAPGKVVNGPDFSFDARRPELRHLDAFGHGTHLAGIIAGVAPQARLVNVKAANAEGVTSLTQLLLAIDYAVRYRRANGLDIRVITLAVGADNDSGYERAPLAYAVERAWNAGIAVVAAAGNDGNSGKGLELPAADPFVLAVGGAETQGTADPSDDEIADWSSRGDGARNPDVIAPGSSIVSYRVPGSFIDQSSQGRIGDDAASAAAAPRRPPPSPRAPPRCCSSATATGPRTSSRPPCARPPARWPATRARSARARSTSPPPTPPARRASRRASARRACATARATAAATPSPSAGCATCSAAAGPAAAGRA